VVSFFKGDILMKVYLVRHGEAGRADRDRDRKLTEHGKEQVASLAKNMQENKLNLSKIYHSGLVRAEETSSLLKKNLGTSVELEQRKGLLPDDMAESWLDELEYADDDEEIMLVGHNPFMTILSATLLKNGDVVSFSPANAACFNRVGVNWELSWICRPSV
tara:strand:- start:252 stop:734 length:483 start_codon:yes stop_codon:yes gene_type:complete